jgi:hypothetical protein
MASRRGQTQEPMSEEKIMDVILTLMRDVRIENNEKIERNQKEMEEVFIRNREENRAGFEKLQSMMESVINRLDHQQESLQQAHIIISKNTALNFERVSGTPRINSSRRPWRISNLHIFTTCTIL